MIFRLSILLMVLLLAVLQPLAPGFAQESRPEPSCIRCHAGQDDEDLSRPVAEWKKSVHASNGISCPDCHGGDMTLEDEDAMDPDKGFLGAPDPEEIPAFCGRCHPGVKDDYLVSAHGKALGKGGPQCVTCHGSHAIVLPSVELINPTRCTTCHSYERAATIRKALVHTDGLIAGLHADLGKLHRQGIDVKDLAAKLFNSRNTFHRLFHTVDVEKVRKETKDIQGRLATIRQDVSAIEKRLMHRRQAGAVVVVLLLALAAAFFYLRHTYHLEEEEKRKHS